MKKLLLLAIIALLPCLAMAQNSSTKPHDEYCLLTASNKLLSSKIGIKLTFKQQAIPADLQLATEARKITFATIVDALDYMAERGWQLVTAYSDTTDPTTVRYILRKPVS
jgi:hypothetical protein